MSEYFYCSKLSCRMQENSCPSRQKSKSRYIAVSKHRHKIVWGLRPMFISCKGCERWLPDNAEGITLYPEPEANRWGAQYAGK